MNDETQTSEELHGIIKQPEPTCQMIDAVIKQLNDAESHMRRYERLDDVEELHDMLGRVESELFGWDTPRQRLEKIRRHVEQIRAWGEAWKRLCLETIEEASK